MPCGRRSSGAARRTRRCPTVAPLDFRPGAVGCEGCGLVCVPAEGDGRCPRCGSAVHERKPDSLVRTWAFVIAAAILYIPANVYPVLTVIQLGAGAPSTILGGVEELLASRMYPLALLVFFASILVPMFKLIGLSAMLLATQLGGPDSGAAMLLRERTRLYYIVAWIGRWSMVDIFMESLLGALVQFGRAVTIEPGIGAVAFCAVVLHHHLRRRSLRPAADVGRRGPQRPPSIALRPRLSRHRGIRPQLRAKAKPSLIVWYSLRPAVGSTVVNWYPADSLAPRPISRISPP